MVRLAATVMPSAHNHQESGWSERGSQYTLRASARTRAGSPTPHGRSATDAEQDDDAESDDGAA